MESRLIFEGRELKDSENKMLGVSGENEQELLVFSFEDGFREGTCYLELEFPNGKKGHVELEKDIENECYKLEVRNSLLKQAGAIKMQLKVVDKTAVWKCLAFEMYVENAINAVETMEEDYPNFVEYTSIRLQEMEAGFEQMVEELKESQEKLSGLQNYDDSEIRKELGSKASVADLEGLATEEYVADEVRKVKIPSKTSELENDSNFVADANYVHTDNNYTTEEKEKLESLSNYDDTEIKEQLATKGNNNLKLEDNLWYFEANNDYVTYDKNTNVTHFKGTNTEQINFIKIFLEEGTYYYKRFETNGTIPAIGIWNSNDERLKVFNSATSNGVIEITTSGIYKIGIIANTDMNGSAKFYFGKNNWLNFKEAKFIFETLRLQSSNFEDGILTEEMFEKNLYEKLLRTKLLYSNEILATNNHENLTYTNSASGFYVINKNLINNANYLNKVVFYGVVNKVITFYLVHKINNSEYEAISEKYQTVIESNNKSEYIFNMDLSEYDNVYLVVDNCSFNSAFAGKAIGFNNVTLSDGVFTEGAKHETWEMYVDIYMNDYKTFNDINLINRKAINMTRTLNSDYTKNLKMVVNERFTKFNDDFSCANSVISENGLICSGYTKTLYKKGTAIDLVRIVGRFKYSEDCKFGVYLANMLGYVDTDTKTLNLCGDYGQANTIPNSSASEVITFDFVSGNEYVIELMKNAMDYTLNITDLATMTVVSTSYHIKNSGLGVPGIVSFSGNILCTEFKYYLPNFSYAKVLFLGDSVTEGVGVTDLTKRWCYQLMEKYFGNDGVIAGVGGNTTAQGLTRLNEILKLGYEFEYVIVFLGLNDLRFDNLEVWKTNIIALRERIIESGFKAIICVPQILNANIDSCNLARNFILEKKWDCIRFDLTGLTALHPNDEGHDLMYEIACKSLDTIM